MFAPYLLFKFCTKSLFNISSLKSSNSLFLASCHLDEGVTCASFASIIAMSYFGYPVLRNASTKSLILLSLIPVTKVSEPLKLTWTHQHCLIAYLQKCSGGSLKSSPSNIFSQLLDANFCKFLEVLLLF